MKSKIRSRLLLYFSGSLLVFSLMIGLTFSALFSQHNMSIHKALLERRAQRIAQSLAGFWAGGNQSPIHGMMGQMGYGAYLRFLDEIAMADVWVVDRNLEQITRSHGQSSIAPHNLPPEAEAAVTAALTGKTTFSESFGAFLGEPSVTVAAPIMLADGKIDGVVLLHEQVKNIQGATQSGLLILLLSMGAAIVISFFIAGALAGRFTKPLGKMKTAALNISGGDYTVKSGVTQDDEIGELAAALDDMAAKLDAASKESVKLEQLRREFVANISHELRTPVTVIRGSLEALCDGVVSDGQMVRDYQRQMLAESIYLERLVSDLLDLSRLQNADFGVELGRVDLREVAEDAVRSIRRVADGKRVEVRLSHAGEGFFVYGDYGRLRQLLLILQDNAVKFSPCGGMVEVSLAAEPAKITLSVRDEGPGIATEDLPYIFERFYKQRSEENKNGTGLGLAIAKQIADRHGAVLNVKNNQGAGCEFSLTIKRSDGTHLST